MCCTVWPAWKMQPAVFLEKTENEGGSMSIVETEIEKPAVQGAAMEITVSRQDLVKELTATQSVVERKTTIPILSNFLIEADGESLSITATDLDQAIRTSAPAKVKSRAPAPSPRASSTTTSSCSPTEIFPSSCWITTGSRSAAAAPTPRWSAWPAPTIHRSPSFQPWR